jgi:hypothetical protein
MEDDNYKLGENLCLKTAACALPDGSCIETNVWDCFEQTDNERITPGVWHGSETIHPQGHGGEKCKTCDEIANEEFPLGVCCVTFPAECGENCCLSEYTKHPFSGDQMYQYECECLVHDPDINVEEVEWHDNSEGLLSCDKCYVVGACCVPGFDADDNPIETCYDDIRESACGATGPTCGEDGGECGRFGGEDSTCADGDPCLARGACCGSLTNPDNPSETVPCGGTDGGMDGLWTEEDCGDWGGAWAEGENCDACPALLGACCFCGPDNNGVWDRFVPPADDREDCCMNCAPGGACKDEEDCEAFGGRWIPGEVCPDSWSPDDPSPCEPPSSCCTGCNTECEECWTLRPYDCVHNYADFGLLDKGKPIYDEDYEYYSQDMIALECSYPNDSHPKWEPGGECQNPDGSCVGCCLPEVDPYDGTITTVCDWGDNEEYCFSPCNTRQCWKPGACCHMTGPNVDDLEEAEDGCICEDEENEIFGKDCQCIEKVDGSGNPFDPPEFIEYIWQAWCDLKEEDCTEDGLVGLPDTKTTCRDDSCCGACCAGVESDTDCVGSDGDEKCWTWTENACMEIDSDADPAYMWSACPAPEYEETPCMDPGCGYGCFCNCECAPDDWTPPDDLEAPDGTWETYCEFINDPSVDPDDYDDDNVDWLYEDGISHLDCADMEEGSCCYTDESGDGQCDDNNGEGINKSDCGEHLTQDGTETYFTAGGECDGESCDVGACCLDVNGDGDVDGCLDDQYRIQCLELGETSLGFGGKDTVCGDEPWLPCELRMCCYAGEASDGTLDHYCTNTSETDCIGSTYNGNWHPIDNWGEPQFCPCCGSDCGCNINMTSCWPCDGGDSGTAPGACCVRYAVGGAPDFRGYCYITSESDCDSHCEDVLECDTNPDITCGNGNLGCTTCWHKGHKCSQNSSLCDFECGNQYCHDDNETSQIMCQWYNNGNVKDVKISGLGDCGSPNTIVDPNRWSCVSPSRSICDLGEEDSGGSGCPIHGGADHDRNYFDCGRVIGCCILDMDLHDDDAVDDSNVVQYVTYKDCLDIHDGEGWLVGGNCCVNDGGVYNSCW